MRRTTRIFGGLAVLTIVLLPATGQAARDPAATATLAQQTPAPLSTLERDGQELFLASCASCHGGDFQGVSGNGPSLRDAGGAAAVDYVLRTGRMPLSAPGDIPRRRPPRFTEEQIRALVAYAGLRLGDATLPTANPSGDAEVLRRGHRLFQENCAACHGVNGAGAAIGGGFDAPSLLPVDARTVAEAMRIGPGRMPVFSGVQYPQEDVDAIASWVLTLGTRSVDRGGLPIGGRGPVAEGFVAWIIGLGLIVWASRLIGTRTPRDPAAPHGTHGQEDKEVSGR